MQGLSILLLTLGLSSCSSGPKSIAKIKTQEEAQKHSRRPDFGRALTQEERTKLVQRAILALGHGRFTIQQQTFSQDALGFVKACFASIGRPLDFPKEFDSIKGLYLLVKKRNGLVMNDPKPGDLVFFHNTFDQSRNGRMNDALTHVGIVEKIDQNTVSFINFQVKSVIRSKMNLANPTLTHEELSKKRINHILRRAQGEERAYTSAELFAGFGRL